MTTTGAGQNGGGVTKTRGTNGTGHGGASLAGDFIWSLTYTDLASQWIPQSRY